jgi:putative oxidoreductase
MTDARIVPYAALILRLTLSFFFFAHLIRKFVSVGYDKWYDGFIKQGYADWMLLYTVGIEFAGAVLLALGIYTRTVSLLALPVLIAVCVHWSTRRGFWFADGGIEFPLAWVMMLIVQIMLGNGAFAVRVPELPWEKRLAGAAA